MYVLISDGGPQYQETNRILEEYCKHVGIIHRTSSALNPESNGFAEAAVCTLKSQVRKATQGKKDWERALAINNAMQRSDKSGSPSEIFLRIPGLTSHPKHKSGFKEAQEIRGKNRDKQTA